MLNKTMETKVYFLSTDDEPMMPFYIGITSRTLEQRLKAHLELGKNRPKNYNSRKIHKLLGNNKKILITKIQSFSNRIDACNKEIELIAQFRKQGYKLTNLTDGGDCGPIMCGDLNPSKRLEVRQKISNSKKGKLRPDLSKRNKDNSSKKVLQFDLKQNLINSYKSVREASRITGIGKSGIYNNCNHLSNSSAGYIWRYENG